MTTGAINGRDRQEARIQRTEQWLSSEILLFHLMSTTRLPWYEVRGEMQFRHFRLEVAD